MPYAVLGSAPAGRFPRWGYLDRLETNANMPRAGATALALATLALLAFVVAQRFVFGDVPPVRVAPGSGPVVVPLPMPPPSIDPGRGERPAQVKFELTVPVPVDDGEAVQPTVSVPEGSRKGGDGDGGSPGPGVDDGDGYDYEVIDPTPPPLPEDFVPVEHMPELVHMRAPDYPDLARAAGIEGTVLVRVLVGEDGFVKKSMLLQSVLGLDEAALDASATAVFRPARQQGRPVAVWVVIPIEFRLRP